MQKEIIKKLSELNPWWRKENWKSKYIHRSSYLKKIFDKKNKHIDILIGARRVGKSSLMFSIIDKLISAKIRTKNIFYITSDSRLFDEYTLFEILETIITKSKKYYIFIDEIQDLDNWQKAIKYYYDNFNVKFYLTGSSSLILKPQTGKLTGRFLLWEILPLSFKEFILFKQSNSAKHSRDKKNLSSKKIDSLLEEYLKTGGYPEYILTGESKYLKNAYEGTLYRDLLSEYGIRNPVFLKKLLNYLADKVTTSVSPLTIAKDLKVNPDTARFYLQYLIDVYLIYPVYKQGNSHKITRSSLPKYYFNDIGILYNRSLEPKIGSLVENAVYLHFRRKLTSPEYADIYYYVKDNQEVDFVVGKEKKKFEVKYRSNVTSEGLIKYNDIEDLTLVVKDYVDEGFNFKQIKLGEFLLENNSEDKEDQLYTQKIENLPKGKDVSLEDVSQEYKLKL